MEDSQVANVLSEWDNHLLQCWRDAGTSSGMPCIAGLIIAIANAIEAARSQLYKVRRSYAYLIYQFAIN